MVEIRREGWKARRVFRVRPPPPLHRYFAKTVVRRGMSRGEEEREEEAPSADSTISGRLGGCLESKAGDAPEKRLAGKYI
jgi:hypothetical protein